jgi:hypothetical protein
MYIKTFLYLVIAATFIFNLTGCSTLGGGSLAEQVGPSGASDPIAAKELSEEEAFEEEIGEAHANEETPE